MNVQKDFRMRARHSVNKNTHNWTQKQEEKTYTKLLEQSDVKVIRGSKNFSKIYMHNTKQPVEKKNHIQKKRWLAKTEWDKKWGKKNISNMHKKQTRKKSLNINLRSVVVLCVFLGVCVQFWHWWWKLIEGKQKSSGKEHALRENRRAKKILLLLFVLAFGLALWLIRAHQHKPFDQYVE